MPYPAQINREQIIELAREMIEAEGVDQLSLHQLAAALGVKTPSLYRYVKNKTDLLRAINEETFRGLFRAIDPALHMSGEAQTRLRAVALAYRDYAHSCPATYGLVYTNTIAELRPDEDEQEVSVLPFQAVMAEIAGEADSLAALRGLMALIHGFVMLELAQQYRRGGDLDEAFVKSVEAYLSGWEQG